MTLFAVLAIALMAASATTSLLKYKVPAWTLGFLSLAPLAYAMPITKAVFIWLGMLSFVFMLTVFAWGWKRP